MNSLVTDPSNSGNSEKCQVRCFSWGFSWLDWWKITDNGWWICGFVQHHTPHVCWFIIIFCTKMAIDWGKIQDFQPHFLRNAGDHAGVSPSGNPNRWTRMNLRNHIQRRRVANTFLDSKAMQNSILGFLTSSALHSYERWYTRTLKQQTPKVVVRKSGDPDVFIQVPEIGQQSGSDLLGHRHALVEKRVKDRKGINSVWMIH